MLLLARAAAALARTLRGGAATFFSELLQPLKHVRADVLAHGAGCARDCENAKTWAVYYITTDPMIARADECIELHATFQKKNQLIRKEIRTCRQDLYR